MLDIIFEKLAQILISFITEKYWPPRLILMPPRLILMLKNSNSETHIDGEKKIIEFLNNLK